jgi:zinc protease
MPGADIEYALHQRFLPEITLDEVNKLAKDWLNDQNRIVIINAPDKPGVTIPDEAKLAAAIKTASSKTMTAYVDKAASQSLMDTLPQAGSIVKTNTREPGITEWELSNGVKVVLKPTSNKADEILFRAFSPGGTSLASDADFIPATTAVQVVTAGGLGKFSAIDLRKVLTGKVASARPFIGETDEGVTGSSSKRDLETMFQLIYLTFTAPRPDEEAFAVQSGQTRTLLANQTASPDYAFAKTLTETIYQNHPRRRLTTPETVDQWNLEKSLAFYKSRFADASDFTFVFVGDFDVNAIKPLAERYLASLPAIRRQEAFKDIGVRPPKGAIEKTVEKGVEPKSQVAIVFSGPMQYDPAHRIALGAAANVLQDRLRETIREELGGTYSITVSPSTQKNPNPEYNLVVQFTCDPSRTADLTKRVFQEIARFRNEGPTPEQTSNVKETLLRSFETSSMQNQYLLTVITSKYQYGEDVAGVWQVPEVYQKLDSAAIQQAAKTYLDPDNHVQVTLVPEKK